MKSMNFKSSLKIVQTLIQVCLHIHSNFCLCYLGPEITTHQPIEQRAQCQQNVDFHARKKYESLCEEGNTCQVLNGPNPLRFQFTKPRRVNKVIIRGEDVTCGIADGFQVKLTPGGGTCNNCAATYCFLESLGSDGDSNVCSYFCKANHATAAVDLYFTEGKTLCKVDFI